MINCKVGQTAEVVLCGEKSPYCQYVVIATGKHKPCFLIGSIWGKEQCFFFTILCEPLLFLQFTHLFSLQSQKGAKISDVLE